MLTLLKKKSTYTQNFLIRKNVDNLRIKFKNSPFVVNIKIDKIIGLDQILSTATFKKVNSP